MAKSRRKRKQELSAKRQEKGFFKAVFIVTIVLLVLLYTIYRFSIN
jgi:hypothetical protein